MGTVKLSQQDLCRMVKESVGKMMAQTESDENDTYTKEDILKIIDRTLQYYDTENYYEPVRSGMRIIGNTLKMKFENPQKLSELGIEI